MDRGTKGMGPPQYGHIWILPVKHAPALDEGMK